MALFALTHRRTGTDDHFSHETGDTPRGFIQPLSVKTAAAHLDLLLYDLHHSAGGRLNYHNLITSRADSVGGTGR